MDITVIILIGLVGILVGWIIGRFTAPERKALSAAEEELTRLRGENSAREQRLDEYRAEAEKRNEEVRAMREQADAQGRDYARLEANYKNLQDQMRKERSELEELQKRFESQFENLANKILEEKSKKFTSHNEEKIGAILNPLKERIEKFEQKVGDTYEKQMRDREGLKTEVRKLFELNSKISEEANNLTRALKGDSKAQGTWGELILEKILEQSGLNRGQEFTVQESVTSENGQRLQPDVVVKLPGDKNIVIDSKVSLLDYERYVSEEDPEQQEAHLSRHIRSVREHVKGLTKKDYNQLHGIKGLDFVLMFIPVEPAYQLALRHDKELFNKAFNDQIVLVGPTTLMVTLRTIAISWRHEYQNQNVLEIARQGGALYDKFVSFVDELEKVGSNLDRTQKSYFDSMKKLSEGKGNLVRRAEKLRELGSRATKKLPDHLVEQASHSEGDDG